MTTITETPSLGGRMLELLATHLELVQLEFRYERGVGRRRLFITAFAVLCLVSAFVFMQIVLTVTLLKWGLPLFAACLALACFWAAVGVGMYLLYGQRNARAHEPFAGTREELSRSLQWIQKHIS
jgi:uncharacterized membrane protein YqjE